MNDPTFITAMATLITSVTALIKVFQNARQIEATHETLKVVDHNTNSALTSLQQNVTDLRSVQATQAEVAARQETGQKVVHFN